MPADPASVVIFLWAVGSLTAIVIALAAFLETTRSPSHRTRTRREVVPRNKRLAGPLGGR
jgi:hypothetical protein